MRTAPIATSGAGAVLFEGPAAAQLVQDPARRSAERHAAAQDRVRGQRRRRAAERAGDQAGPAGRRADPVVVDDPLLAVAPGKAPLFGNYRIDDEGVAGPARVADRKGVLKSLLMSRTPRKEIAHSNGHARAPRFSGAARPRRHAGGHRRAAG